MTLLTISCMLSTEVKEIWCKIKENGSTYFNKFLMVLKLATSLPISFALQIVQARNLDEALAKGSNELGVLAGVPIAIKVTVN